MDKAEVKALFDQQAAGYEQQLLRLAAINKALYFLLEAVFAELPVAARVLCVGVGTGHELVYLGNRFPDWHFTAVEPSGAMLDRCRQRVEAAGFSSRCDFHEGYLDSLPVRAPQDAATCFLVSQFIMEKAVRSALFQDIATRLRVGGVLASSDLCAAVDSEAFATLLPVWHRIMTASDPSPEALSRVRRAYTRDVAVLPPAEVAALIKLGGFETPRQFFQAGLIHAWFAKRAASSDAARG